MGLPTALLIARDPGFEVVGIDVARDKVEALSRGVLPFDEQGMVELFAEAKPRFRASTEVCPADIYILALPTPLTPQRTCDASYLESAIDSLVPVVADGNLVIIESTVSPGTTLRMRERLYERSGKRPIVSYVSEKALPGNTLHEMIHNDRTIGVADPSARAPTEALYRTFVEGELVFTDATTAETAKLFENTCRDVNIALANELADLCETLGIDVHETISIANRHPRVNLLRPGPGVGGHCIAIDPWFLTEGGFPAPLISKAREINDSRPARVARRVMELTGSPPATIALLGTAYKGNVDDDRESPSYEIRDRLVDAGYDVRLHDPHVQRQGISADLRQTLSGADTAVLATAHRAYQGLDLRALGFEGRLVVDTHGLWRDAPPAGPRYVLLGAGATDRRPGAAKGQKSP